MEALRFHFRPEFLNRLDDIIIFHALNKEDIKKIVDIQIGRLNRRLAESRLTLNLSLRLGICWQRKVLIQLMGRDH